MESYRLYSRLSDRETVLELWGASTKHPDSVFYYSEFKLSPWCDKVHQTVPWILECASLLNLPYHSYALARWACDMYEGYRGWNK